MKGIRKLCQLMKKCDGHGGYVNGCGEVCHLSLGRFLGDFYLSFFLQAFTRKSNKP